MEFIKRDVPATKRNGEMPIIINNYYSGGEGSGNSSGSGGETIIKGDYLPAKMGSDGVYHVSLDKVIFDGSIESKGEITAYKAATLQDTTPLAVNDFDINEDPLYKVNLIKQELGKVTGDATLQQVKDILINLSRLL